MSEEQNNIEAAGVEVAGHLTLPSGGAIPHLSQWFGYWHYEPQRAAALFDAVRKMDVSAHLANYKADSVTRSVDAGYRYQIVDGVAILQLSGTLLKHIASMDDGTSTVMARRSIRQMIADDSVKAAILVIDSPGGSVSGAYDLADDIQMLTSKKPTYAYVEDLAASAGYLQASQTKQISASRTSLVGCIGTFAVVYDYSQMFENEGVKAILISSGGFKGAGVPGTKITDEQIKEWDREIAGLNDAFIKAVQRGRKMSTEQAKTLADGRVHIADEAKSLGLIDHVESLDALFARVKREVSDPSQTSQLNQQQSIETKPEAQASEVTDQPDVGSSDGGQSQPAPEGAEMESAMAEPIKQGPAATEPKPATITELRKEFADDPDFGMECAEKAMTMTEAKAAYADKLRIENKRLKAEATAPAGKIGSDPVKSDDAKSGNASDGDAIEQFNAAVEEQMKKPGYQDRKKAISAVMKKDPELHQAYLEANNPSRVQRERIKDRFDA